MASKHCDNCGWDFPETYTKTTCRFCGYPILVNASRFKEHEQVRGLQNYYDASKQAASKYKAWLESIREADKTPLTEEQWMEACRYFGGCAYCGRPDIESRSLFIHFKEGGKYCAWNVIPACESCEHTRKIMANPFRHINKKLNRMQYSFANKNQGSEENLQKIVGYLSEKIKEAKR